MKGCFIIVTMLALCAVALGSLAASYAYATEHDWNRAAASMGVFAACIAALLTFSVTTK